MNCFLQQYRGSVLPSTVGVVLIITVALLNCVKRAKHSGNAKNNTVVTKEGAPQQQQAEEKARTDTPEDERDEIEELQSPPHSSKRNGTPLKSNTSSKNNRKKLTDAAKQANDKCDDTDLESSRNWLSMHKNDKILPRTKVAPSSISQAGAPAPITCLKEQQCSAPILQCTQRESLKVYSRRLRQNVQQPLPVSKGLSAGNRSKYDGLQAYSEMATQESAQENPARDVHSKGTKTELLRSSDKSFRTMSSFTDSKQGNEQQVNKNCAPAQTQVNKRKVIGAWKDTARNDANEQGMDKAAREEDRLQVASDVNSKVDRTQPILNTSSYL
uniref:Uncharacterized protein n=1 Tax=Ascaris lumbricoides TaxID=6252 RepID=A0A0M3I7S8_ASCLU